MSTLRHHGIAGRPYVIVDFEVDADALLIVVRNLGDLPAARVRIRFHPSFRGMGGTVEMARLALFSHLEFLAPGRAIRALVDPLHAWFGRARPAEPRVIRITLAYRDGAGRRYRARLRHDLRVFEDLPRLASAMPSAPRLHTT